MTESTAVDHATRTLEAINRELADLLGAEQVDLVSGAEAALRDELVVCGILGGKDVGKSTLINALARTQVSVDAAEVGRGTECPMAYVHQDAASAVQGRLADVGRDVPIDVTLHHADAIRNVVMVDLPDFDSEFEEHLRMVRTVAPRLDRVLWVQTPRKIGDRAWVAMFRDVIKDARNVHCVLNKVDELLTDAEPFAGKNGRQAQAFWQAQDEWMAGAIADAGCRHEADHRFLVAAAFAEPERFTARVAQRWDDATWTRYEADREVVAGVAKLASDDLDRLRDCVLGPVTREEAEAIKTANRRHERKANVARILEHFDLERTVERLGQACEPQYHQHILNEAFGEDYCAEVAAALRTLVRSDSELADELLERRVQPWPLLRLVYWPFGWLSRLVGRRLGSASRAGARAADPFEAGGRALPERVALLRSRLLADHASVVERLGMARQMPEAPTLSDRASSAARRLVPQLEARMLDECDRGGRKPSWFGRAALWLVFLWFPFLQPVLEGGLRMYVEEGTFQFTRGMLQIVSAFSAAHLLMGFAVVAVVYVALLAGMYVRGLRRIQHVRQAQDETSPFADAVDGLLITEIVTPLVEPLQVRWMRLHDLRQRLDAIASDDG